MRDSKLEADKGFLKHWIISLRKGDKDLDLIQEILQHLLSCGTQNHEHWRHCCVRIQLVIPNR